MKTGRLSKQEQQFIIDNCEHKSYQFIAEKLNRNPDSIKRYIEEKLGKETSLSVDSAPVKNAKNEITEKPFWPYFKQQFTPVEQDILIYHWNNIQLQFDHDVLPTEESQILDLIKLEVMMYRNLMSQRQCEDGIRRIDMELELIDEEGFEDDKEKTKRINDIIREKMSYTTSSAALLKDYRDTQNEKNKLYKDLKATRADRIKRIDSRRESFISWIEDLISNPELRREMGIKMEKMRLAMESEYERLSEYIKYDDDKIDQPLLNYDTVKDDNE